MTETTLTGKRVLLVVPVTQFREEEVFEPKQLLEDAGAEVTIQECDRSPELGAVLCPVVCRPDWLPPCCGRGVFLRVQDDGSGGGPLAAAQLLRERES